jgi:LysM repeat protein
MANTNPKNTKPVVTVRNTAPDSETVMSMILGAMVVVVLGALVFSYIRDWRSRQQASTTAEATPSPTPLIVEELPSEVVTETTDDGQEVPVNLPAQYIVKEGDSTWKIAEAFFGSGFNYVDIEDANGLQSNQDLTVGQELTIPKMAVRTKDNAGQPRAKITESKSNATPQPGPSKGDNSAAEAEMKKSE